MKNKNKYDKFKAEVIALMKEHQVSVSHEDTQGAFILEDYDEENVEWFKDAKVKHD